MHSQSVWSVGGSDQYTTKHIDVKYHFIKDREGVDITMSWIPTEDNTADIRGTDELFVAY